MFKAADQLSIKCGKSEIILKKNGNISIKGNKIDIKASGKMTLKGSQIARELTMSISSIADTLPIREGDIIALTSAGLLSIRDDDGIEVSCRILEVSAAAQVAFAVGDRALMLCPPGLEGGYVLGRVSTAPFAQDCPRCERAHRGDHRP